MVNFTPPTDTVPTPIVRQVIREIAKGDVLYVSFQRLQQAMVVDLREGEVDRPALMVARHVQTIEQQVRLVEDLRPGFATIQHFSSVPWGGSTRAFADQGVLSAILGRLPTDMTREVMAVFEQLRQLEIGPVKMVAPVETSSDTEKTGEDDEGDEEPDDQDIARLTDATTPGGTSAEG